MESNSDILFIDMFTQGQIHIRNAMNGMAMTMIPDQKSKKSTQLAMFYLKPELMHQQFHIGKRDGRYVIKNIGTQKVLDVESGNNKVYSEVIGYEHHGKSNQVWALEEQNNGFFYIMSAKSGLVLEVEGGIDAEGMKVVQNNRYNNLNQLWKLEPA